MKKDASCPHPETKEDEERQLNAALLSSMSVFQQGLYMYPGMYPYNMGYSGPYGMFQSPPGPPTATITSPIDAESTQSPPLPKDPPPDDN